MIRDSVVGAEMLAVLELVDGPAIGALGLAALGHVQVDLGVAVPDLHVGQRAGTIHAALSIQVFGQQFNGELAHGVLSGGGYDPKDSTSINAPVPQVVAAAKSGDVKGMKIGVVKELNGDGYQAGVRQRFEESLELLAQAGAEIVEVSAPNFEYALAAYYLIAPSECSSNLARFDAMRYGLRVGDTDGASAESVMNMTREVGFGREVKRRILLGTYALSSGYYDAYYGSAQKVRTLITQDFNNAFAKCDVMVSPTCPTTAFKIGEKANDPLAMYLNDIATIPVNMAGIGGMSLPCGVAPEDGLPVGFQIMSPVMQDQRMYSVGAALEAALLSKWGAPLLSQAPSLGGAA